MIRPSVIMLSLVCATTLGAQEDIKWVALQGAYVKPYHVWAKDTVSFGAAAGWWLTDRWGADFSAMSSRVTFKDSPLTLGTKGTETHFAVSTLFNLKPGAQTWIPYLRGGLGAAHQPDGFLQKPSGWYPLFVIGGGLQYLPSEHWFSSLELKGQRINWRERRNEVLGVAGVGYRWGGKKTVVPPPPPPPPPPPVEEPAPVPPPPPPVEEPKPVPPPVPQKYALVTQGTLHFANADMELSPEDIAAARQAAESLKAYPSNYKLVITGHASKIGSAKYNQRLSEHRAERVAAVLKELGVPADRIVIQGKSYDQPVADNSTREGRAQNRRAQILVEATENNVEPTTITTNVVTTPPRK